MLQLHFQSKFPEIGRQSWSSALCSWKPNCNKQWSCHPCPETLQTHSNFFLVMTPSVPMPKWALISASELPSCTDSVVEGHVQVTRVAEMLSKEGCCTLWFEVHQPEAHPPEEIGFMSLLLHYSCLAGSQLQSIPKRDHYCLCSARTAQADKSLIHTAPAPRNHHWASFNYHFNPHSRQVLTQCSPGVSPLSLISQSGRSFQSLPWTECQGWGQPFAKMRGSVIAPCFLLSEIDLGKRRAVG